MTERKLWGCPQCGHVGEVYRYCLNCGYRFAAAQSDVETALADPTAQTPQRVLIPAAGDAKENAPVAAPLVETARGVSVTVPKPGQKPGPGENPEKNPEKNPESGAEPARGSGRRGRPENSTENGTENGPPTSAAEPKVTRELIAKDRPTREAPATQAASTAPTNGKPAPEVAVPNRPVEAPTRRPRPTPAKSQSPQGSPQEKGPGKGQENARVVPVPATKRATKSGKGSRRPAQQSSAKQTGSISTPAAIVTKAATPKKVDAAPVVPAEPEIKASLVPTPTAPFVGLRTLLAVVGVLAAMVLIPVVVSYLPTPTDDAQNSASANTQAVPIDNSPSTDPNEPEKKFWNCWDNSIAKTADQCGRPEGLVGLRWVFPSFGTEVRGCLKDPDLRIEEVPTVLSWTCNQKLVDGQEVVIQYSQVTTALAAYQELVDDPWLTKPPDFANVNNGGLPRYDWYRKKGDGSVHYVMLYSSYPFLISVDAPDGETLERVLAQVARARPPNQIRGVFLSS